MINKSIHYFFAFFIFICILTACSFKERDSGEGTAAASTDPLNFLSETDNESTTETEPIIKAEPAEEHLRDNKELYKNQDDYSVITMYLTVSKGNAGDGTDHTWFDVNAYSENDYAKMGIKDRFKAEGLLQIDETGKGITESSFGYGETIPNVSVQMRGQSSTSNRQKNYKVRIKDGRGSFRGQRTLNLTKHMTEAYRFTNKLCYDLGNTIPEIIAGRTQFVHLYVKDETSDEDSFEKIFTDIKDSEIKAENDTVDHDGFKDYGLYTMAEQVNRTYLKNHGFDENGQLYKLSFFEWTIQEDLMLDQDDPSFDQSKFDEFLESKVNDNHDNLQKTLSEVNNYSIPIDKILEEHFDIDNMMYFLAFNILNGNDDVGPRNLFLYSPLNSEKFYFICWDMDGSMQANFRETINFSEGKSWSRGMTKYLILVLVNRMMKEQKYRDMLSAAVDDIYQNYFSPQIVEARAKKYAEVVKPFLFSSPDFYYSPIKDQALYDELVSKLGDEVEQNYKDYQESLKWPWPFYVDLPTVDYQKNTTTFSWGASYNYGRNVTYDYMLATDYLFENVLYEGHNLVVPAATIKSLSPGTYYLKVTATGDSGYTIDCFDYYPMEDGGKYFGCFCFTVNNDGTVVYS